MKVLSFLTSISLKGGGPSRSVPMLVKGLAELGVDITLMTQRSADMNTHALESSSAKMKILEEGYSDFEVENYLLSEKFDIVQVQSMWDLRYHRLVKIASKHNIPYIITPRGMLEPWSMTQKRWKKKLAMLLYQKKDLNTSACVYTTANSEANHVRMLGIKAPLAVIPNGVETRRYSPRKSISGVKKQVMFLSRIHSKKGIELLIRAWSRLHNEFRDWSLIIVGNGEPEYINELNSLVRSLHMSDSISINEPIYGDAKLNLYYESSIFVLPSFSENFGMVIAEALSCGVPVITTNGTPWQALNGVERGEKTIIDGNNKMGWCIDLTEDNLFSALLDAMSKTPEDLFQMGQRGSRYVLEHYDYISIAKQTKDLYEWIIGNGSQPAYVSL